MKLFSVRYIVLLWISYLRGDSLAFHPSFSFPKGEERLAVTALDSNGTCFGRERQDCVADLEHCQWCRLSGNSTKAECQPKQEGESCMVDGQKGVKLSIVDILRGLRNLLSCTPCTDYYTMDGSFCDFFYGLGLCAPYGTGWALNPVCEAFGGTVLHEPSECARAAQSPDCSTCRSANMMWCELPDPATSFCSMDPGMESACQFANGDLTSSCPSGDDITPVTCQDCLASDMSWCRPQGASYCATTSAQGSTCTAGGGELITDTNLCSPATCELCRSAGKKWCQPYEGNGYCCVEPSLEDICTGLQGDLITTSCPSTSGPPTTCSDCTLRNRPWCRPLVGSEFCCTQSSMEEACTEAGGLLQTSCTIAQSPPSTCQACTLEGEEWCTTSRGFGFCTAHEGERAACIASGGILTVEQTDCETPADCPTETPTDCPTDCETPTDCHTDCERDCPTVAAPSAGGATANMGTFFGLLALVGLLIA